MAGKGLTRLLLALVFAAVFCFLIPHVLFPAMGIGVALPFIYVPGEKIPGTPLTNTLLTTVITTAILLVFAFRATGNMKEVPGRLQGVFEMLVEFMDNLTRNIIGPKSRKVLPLAFSIFLFILLANYIKLLPGFDSVGMLECAHRGDSGYYANGSALYVPSSLNAGFKATEADFEHCEKVNGKFHGTTPAGAATAAATSAATRSAVATKEASAPVVGTTGEGGHGEGDSKPTAEETLRAAVTRKVDTNAKLKFSELSAEEQKLVTEGANGKLTVKQPLREIYFVTPFFRGPASDLTLTLAIALIAVVMIQILGMQENGGAYWYKYFNLPALGNIGNKKKPANGWLGIIDFIVGILEIISEFAKILSFAFRLFGNIFAGQVLIFVMTFLIGVGLPLIFTGLEAFVGIIQPFVFAMLFTVFAGIAMAGHHDGGDEHHEDEQVHA